MAPIKFEEDIKDTLEKRTIEPSSKSWDALSKRLDNIEQKNNKKEFWWLAIAASFVGMFLVYNVLLNTNKENIPTQKVVEIETESIEKNTENALNEIEEVIVEVKDNTVLEIKKPFQKKNNSIKKRQQSEKYLATSKLPKEEIIKTEIAITQSPNTEVLYTSLEKKNKSKRDVKITPENLDSEVERLLKNAENKTSTASINTLIPDHNKLLNEVEDDLERSFRDKLLMVVKDGLDSAKDVVVERYNDNQETK